MDNGKVVSLIEQLQHNFHFAAGLNDAVGKVPNIKPEQDVDVEIIELNEFGPKLAGRPYCHADQEDCANAR